MYIRYLDLVVKRLFKTYLRIGFFSTGCQLFVVDRQDSILPTSFDSALSLRSVRLMLGINIA